MKTKIICFVATRNAASARKFYETTLGLKFVSDDPFATVFDAARIGELTSKGVCFERYPGLPQDELGAWTTPSGAKVAWFKDPDGNTLSLTQFE
jgi:catechol 2,3-dioxygenase-like lactoylglutathione lyase family enzyme